MDVRREIGDRLRAEIARKGLNESSLADLARVSPKEIAAYLEGRKEILFAELNPICAALDISVMRLLSRPRSNVRISYRKTFPTAKTTVARAEDIFLWVKEYLPRFRKCSVSLPKIDAISDAYMLIAEINSFVTQLKNKAASIEAWYEMLGIGVAVFREDRETQGPPIPDGLCLSDDLQTLVFIKLDCPDVRLQFTLLHELWHALCDRNRDIPADYLPAELYDDEVSDETKPEFCANKFAQFWTIPFEDAEKVARKITSPSGLSRQDVEDVLRDTGGSPQVLANAVYDIIRFMPGRKQSFSTIRDEISALATNWSGNPSIRSFVSVKADNLSAEILNHRDEFGDHAWKVVNSLIKI